ncbi:MAG: TIGR00269 family protein [Candidatus Thermoplasmatota archaeon]
MVKHCTKCSKPAITFIRYNGTHLCEKHFVEYFEKRIKKNIKKQGKTRKNTKIAVAVSGGKDSNVALYIINKIFSKFRNVKIIAITIDEGIKPYRDKSIQAAKKNCKKLGIEHHITSFKDVFNITIDEISEKKHEIGLCSYCGVFRRYCMNTTAKELDVDKIVTGHNLDDMSQSILMNFVNSDMEKLARLAPHLKVQPGLIPRMVPLSVIPEKENAIYALVKNIDFHDAQCPNSTEAFRGFFQDTILDLEQHTPGTRHSILSSYEKIKDLLLKKYPPVDLNECEECGEPTSQKICKTCILKKKIGIK